jgi:RNA polymerase sigma-70 factor (ECF subfamily)
LAAARIVELASRTAGMGERTDAELVAQFRAGDATALEALCVRHEGALYHFLLGLVHDHHLAEDLLQETFVRALERLEAVDPDHLRGWLFTVAYHQAMLTKRRRKSRPFGQAPHPENLVDPGNEPAVIAELRDDARRLRELLAQLPPTQQEVIRQRVYEGKRFRDIAAALGCPLNTALARMHEGVKRLKLLWNADHARTQSTD